MRLKGEFLLSYFSVLSIYFSLHLSDRVNFSFLIVAVLLLDGRLKKWELLMMIESDDGAWLQREFKKNCREFQRFQREKIEVFLVIL